ncbi:MAG: response regulator transcription factor [Anaerolineaceae bacterium]|nr:response regulator transcription factor [Anaerolineaceae bacterium]
MSKLRILIADDRQQVRQELRAILPLAGDIEIVGEAADGLEAVHLATVLQPQAVLLDLQMPVMDGCQAAAQIKAVCPICRVVALTIHGDETTRRRAAEAGFDAFIVKGAPISALVEALGQNEEDSHARDNQSQENEEG